MKCRNTFIVLSISTVYLKVSNCTMSEDYKPGRFKGVLFWFMVGTSCYAISTMVVTILAYTALADAAEEVAAILRNWHISPVKNIFLKEVGCSGSEEAARLSWSAVRPDDISDGLGGK